MSDLIRKSDAPDPAAPIRMEDMTLADLMRDPAYGAASQPDPAAIREAALRAAKPRIIPMHSQSMYGVCIGGRWDGWVMVKLPDGYWVSHNKPDPVDPSIPDFAAKGAAE